MPKKALDKKVVPLEALFEDVFVCKQNDCRPFIEIFVQKPENIDQENLGLVAGILEIDDDTEESSYVVNYLISVIKKEYFSRPKRGPIESFEAALHKANLALAQLAEHANVGWIGKINAILMVVEKNNVHFSTTGTSHALLLRNSLMTDIVEEDDLTLEPNPLKTFTDVVSGRLEKNDKLILTTHHIFDIFSLEEIKRSLLKFTSSEFVRFLKTALGNELNLAAVLFAQIQEKKLSEKNPPPSTPKNVNAFSQKSFSKKPARKEIVQPYVDEHQIEKVSPNMTAELSGLKEDVAKASGNFTDKKTGHIYIKGEASFEEKSSPLSIVQEKIEDYRDAGKGLLSRALQGIKERRREPRRLGEVETARVVAPRRTEFSSERGRTLNIFFQKSLAGLKVFVGRAGFFLKDIFFPWTKEASLAIWEKSKDLLVALFLAISSGVVRLRKLYSPRDLSQPRNSATTQNKFPRLGELPKFSHLKEIVGSFSSSQKIYAVLVLVALFIVPYFIAKFSEKPKVQPVVQPEAPAVALPLEKDKNVKYAKETNSRYEGSGVHSIVNLNDAFFAISEKGIYDLENRVEYPFPGNFSLQKSTGMDDLNFLFFLGRDKKMLSWSPVSKKFEENIADLPNESGIKDIETYLTYLYVLDSESNQIYRYPRDTGGFGEKTNWLKDELDLSSIKSMTIGENIYLTDAKNIWKLFQGKKQDFSLEETATPFVIDALHTKRDGQFIYALDRTNKRIVKFNLEGKIVQQYYSEELGGANGFSVDEKNNLLYFSAPGEVGTLPIN